MKNIQELFVPYALAVKAKEKGFNEHCLMIANPNLLWDFPTLRSNSQIDEQHSHDEQIIKIVVAVPLYQQLIDWFRENHDIVLTHSPAIWGNDWFYCNKMGKKTTLLVTDIKDYNEALNKALEEAFKLI